MPSPPNGIAETLDSKALAAVEAIEDLHEALSTAAHPQEFGLEGCPACKVRDVLMEALLLVDEARERIVMWQPEPKS